MGGIGCYTCEAEKEEEIEEEGEETSRFRRCWLKLRARFASFQLGSMCVMGWLALYSFSCSRRPSLFHAVGGPRFFMLSAALDNLPRVQVEQAKLLSSSVVRVLSAGAGTAASLRDRCPRPGN